MSSTTSNENLSIIAASSINDTTTATSSCSAINTSATRSDQFNSIVYLISKLGHDLDEIRSRALDNLISKLSNNVIAEIDLVQQKDLFVKLFELFNFGTFTQHDLVLNLLYKLSKHKSAAKNIQEINGLQFLNALSTDLKSDSQKVQIEQIIERLIQTLNTDSTLAQSSSTSCCSSLTLTYKNTDCNDSSSIIDTTGPLNIHSFQNPSAESTVSHSDNQRNHFISNSISSFNSSDYPLASQRTINEKLESMTINSEDLSTHTRNLLLNMEHTNESSHHEPPGNTFNWLPLTEMDRQFLRTAENSLRSNDPKKIKNYCTFLQTIVFSDFPAEIFLQRSFILKILVDLVIKSFNSRDKQTEEEILSLNKSLICCIHFYCGKLAKRIDYIKNPSTFSDKNVYSNNFESYSRSIYSSRITPKPCTIDSSLYSTHDTASVLSSIADSTISSIANKSQTKLSLSCFNENKESNNQDLQVTIDTIISETKHDNFETDVKQRIEIEQSESWPLYSFCFKLIDTLIENMNVIIVRNNKRCDQKPDTSLLPAICETINNLINILSATKTEWCNLNLNNTLMHLFKKFNFSLKYCLEKLDAANEASSRYLSIFNRLSYLYFIVSFYKLINLMNSSNETSLLMPSELSETIFLILNDICLLDSFTNISCVLMAILNHVDPSLSQVHLLSNEICDSIRNACNFLMQHKEHSISTETLLEMAKKSLSYMDYHKCRQLPESIIDFTSRLIANIDPDTDSTDVEFLVTSCMMSKSPEIRLETYSNISKLVSNAISVQVAIEINSKRYRKIKFLTLNKVFYQLVTFGLFDPNENIRALCENIILHLLQCELLVPQIFQSKLSQLITIYMPFIQCFASQTTSLGQCILKMSDDMLTPVLNEYENKASTSDSRIKVMLDSPVERLRTSLRYLFFQDKTMRKKGYQQTIGFLTKYHSHNTIESNETFIAELDRINTTSKTSGSKRFNLSDFYLRFSADKFADMAIKIKRKGRSFTQSPNSTNNIFQTDNLLRIYNIFASETVDFEVKQNASEQLAIMIATGDERIQKTFISLDGVNYCIRHLRQTLLYKADLTRKFLFLSDVEKQSLDRVQASCISCVCHVLFWQRDMRKLYLFDIEFYRLMFKALLVAYNRRVASVEADNQNWLFGTCQEDLSAILFILLFNQVSRLDFYYESIMKQKSQSDQFDLSGYLRKHLVEPFCLHSNGDGELIQQEKQQWKAYELHYKLAHALKSKFSTDGPFGSVQIKRILDKKFRLYWNFHWHGGSLAKLCNDLIHNKSLIQGSEQTLNQASFSECLYLTKADKILAQYTHPYFLFSQFCDELKQCNTHEEALNLLDFLQILLSIVEGNNIVELGIDSQEIDGLDATLSDLHDSEFYNQRTVKFFFNSSISNWHIALNRFASIMPSIKSKSDQLLFSNSFQTIAKMIRSEAFFSEKNEFTDDNKPETNIVSSSSESFAVWLSNMVHSPSSSLVQMFKQFLLNYESDELRINSYILPLGDFIRVYFERSDAWTPKLNGCFPSTELLEVCIEQIQLCEIEKFRNLNKLAILVNLMSSLLRGNLPSGYDTETDQKNKSMFIQLARSLVQIINTFNIGRGGLSLSFMGNFITKSAHICLLKLVKDSISCKSEQNKHHELVKTVLCLKDHKNNLYGTSWLIPLMLHRESQIRSISFSLISQLINESLARTVLLTNQTGIWSIAFNVLLNNNECSIVRSQSCAFLINMTNILTKTQLNEEQNNIGNISITTLQSMLNDLNFYQQIALTLTSFYPYETYCLSDLKQKNDSYEVSSICSPLLVNSICQLLFNITVLMPEEAILMINNTGIMNLLISYVKPISLLNTDNNRGLSSVNDKNNWRMNEEITDMLDIICRFLNLCCDIDRSCVLMMLENNKNLVYDMIECLGVNAINKHKLKPFLSLLFELFIKFLNYTDDKSILENFLFSFAKCWHTITTYVLSDILQKKSSSITKQVVVTNDTTDASDNRLYENALQFYACFLSKLTLLSEKSMKIKGLVENIADVFDEVNNERTLGSQLIDRLINEFDKNFLVETNQNTKNIISNCMKALMNLSVSAKSTALNAGLVETLIEHLKCTHAKLNLKSLNTKSLLKDNPCIQDLQQTLMILKHMMCNSLEIKQVIAKNGLISVIHSFWCWTLQDQNLLKTTLSTLCTLTANNKLALSLIAQSNVGAQSALANSSSNITGLTLLHSIIKTLQKSYLNSNKSLVIAKFGFSLLTNCAQSNECKSIFWKSNLLQDFTAIDFQSNKANSSKSNFKKESLWLNFLVSLSFTSDGQQLILKVENLLTTILNIFESYLTTDSDISYLSMLILRNVSFNQANKSKLISHGDYINTIVHQLRSKSENIQLLVVSSLDSLLYDYQKAKVILKNANVLKYLVELNEFHAIKQRNHSARIQPIVNNLIKILND